jgi:tetratricopeptide (TPR) repeat protein/CHAT domain-containing protein
MLKHNLHPRRHGTLSLITALLLATVVVQAFAETPPPPKKLTAEEQSQLDKAKKIDREGQRLAGAGKYREALDRAEESLRIRRQILGPEHRETADNIDNAAQMYGAIGDFRSALRLYQQGLAIRRKVLGPEHPDTAESLANIAAVYRAMGDFASALPLCRQALEIRRKVLGPEHRATASSLHNLALLYRALGDCRRALPLAQQSLEINRKLFGPEDPSVANSLSNVAGICKAMGRYAEALPLYQQCLEICRKRYGPDQPATALSMNNLAMLYLEMGEYAKALPLCRRALEIDRKFFGPQHPRTATDLNNLGGLYRDMGEYAKALPLLQQAVDIDRKVLGPDHPDTANSINNLAGVYHGMHDYAHAVPLFEQALEINRKSFGPNHPETARSLGNLGLLCGEMREYDRALPLMQQALDIRRKTLGPEHPDMAKGLNNLAIVYTDLGEFAKALPLYEQARQIDLKFFGPHHPEAATPLGNLAITCYSAGQYARTVELAKQTAEVIDGTLSEAVATLSEAAAMNLAGSQRMEMMLSLLLCAARRSSHPVDDWYPVFWRWRGLFQRIETSRQQVALAQGATPELRDLCADYEETRRHLAQALFAPTGGDAKQAEKRLRRLTELNERKEELESRLARALPGLGRRLDSQRRPHADLAAQLPPQAAFVDLVYYRDLQHDPAQPGAAGSKATPSYAAFVLRRGSATACVPLGPVAPIDRAIEEWRRALVEGKSTAAAATLRQLVWEPIEGHLPPGAKTVYLCPDGALARLPWSALPGRREKTPLLEEYALATIPSGQMLLEQLTAEQPSVAPAGVLLTVGDVAYGDPPAPSDAPFLPSAVALRSAALEGQKAHWPLLPASAQELAGVTDVCGPRQVTRLAGAEAATARVLAELPKARWVHFATHGFFADKRIRSVLQLPEEAFEERMQLYGQERRTVGGRNPLLLSGLVLAGANLPRQQDPFGLPQGDGGILTAEAIATLPLYRLELAVLSACDTGLGDVAGGEGVFGLQRAFHIAGTRNVVATLWKVDDQPTAALMELFYRNLWAKSLPPIEALRQAQLMIYHHPELIAMTSASRGLAFDRLATLPDPGRRPPASATSPPRHWAAFVLSGAGS